ncbi:MAG: hypothetical protein CL546_11965 [Alcanivorax sp.]|nr:hypothetical protein [Alcanivorax sp.]
MHWLKRWLTPGRKQHKPEQETGLAEEKSEIAPGPALGEHHAAHGSDEDPEPLHRGRRRLKETYTSHWDLDYMPRDELEEVLSGEADKPASDDGKKNAE